MTKLLQILLLSVAVQWFEVHGKPLFQGVSFQRGFEINFKPLPRKPISLLMEKWSPLGVFGRKHSIQKRSSDSEAVPDSQVVQITPATPMIHRPAAPVFEHVEDSHMDTSPLTVLPSQTYRTLIPVPISSPVPPPLFSAEIPLKPTLTLSFTSSPLDVIMTPVTKPFLTDSPPTGDLFPEKTISRDWLLPPPFSTQGGVLSSSRGVNSRVPSSGRYTDISRAEPTREYLDSVQSNSGYFTDGAEKVAPQLENNSIQAETVRNDVNNESSLVRGSKLALYYGSIFLQLMSQFFTNARATFNQMTNPPPIYNN